MSDGKSVAIIIDDLTEFYGIRDAIDNLIRNNIDVDLYIPRNYSDELKENTLKTILQLGYTAYSEFDAKKRYKILLEPYPIADDGELNFEFRIKYRYAPVSVKPNPVCSPEWNLPYDAFIVYNKKDADIFSVYGRVYIVPYSKFFEFKKINNRGKPNLLYLPTFGDISSINDIDQQTVAQLKQEYNVIIKAHHAVQYRQDERENYYKLKKLADEFYDSDTPLVNLLAKSDVVLSDNSSAVFDAIYSETPVAIFSDRQKLNLRRLVYINTFQYELVSKGVIPCATKSAQIMRVLDQAIEKLPEQNKIKYDTFVFDEDNSSSHFVTVIKEYLSKDRRNSLHDASKDILLNSWKSVYASANEVKGLRSKAERLEQEVGRVTSRYEDSASWRITKPLRKVKYLVGKIGK